MTVQMQIPYVEPTGALTEAGYALIERLETENRQMRKEIETLRAALVAAGLI